jgi:hypothetical protein
MMSKSEISFSLVSSLNNNRVELRVTGWKVIIIRDYIHNHLNFVIKKCG